MITSHTDTVWRSRVQNPGIEMRTADPHRMCDPVGTNAFQVPTTRGCMVASPVPYQPTKGEQNRIHRVLVTGFVRIGRKLILCGRTEQGCLYGHDPGSPQSDMQMQVVSQYGG